MVYERRMRTTLNLREDLVAEAVAVTRISDLTTLVHAGLERRIAAEVAQRPARLGGSDPRAAAGRRRPSSTLRP